MAKKDPALSTKIKGSTGPDFHAGDAFEHSGGFVKVTDRLHAEIHEGEAYATCYIFEAVGDDAFADILIQTGSEKELHTTFSIKSDGKSHAFLYREPDFSGGTPLDIVNRDEASSNTSDATAVHSPSVDSVLGFQVICELIPGGTGGNTVGGVSVGGREEIILATNTAYLFRGINKAGLQKDLGVVISHYEEPPRT